MGTYYRLDNHDKKESIDLASVANIKYGCFERWSLQQAILIIFLGFDLHRSGLDLGKWVGRWELDRIRVHGDYEDDAECDEWNDIGMMFLHDLYRRGIFEKWIKVIGFEENLEYYKKELEEWINEEGKECGA